MNLDCPSCGRPNSFEQPYPYHGGFGDQAVLYNDAGNCTLVWSILDPIYTSILARHSPDEPWGLTRAAKEAFERLLPPSPVGDAWRFSNSPRCSNCKRPLTPPMGQANIYYLVYPHSVVLDLAGPHSRTLEAYIADPSYFRPPEPHPRGSAS
jgi:hypothetical protein